MNDEMTRERRQDLYESIIPIEVKNEVSRKDYLCRLTKAERQNLSHLFTSFETLFKAANFLALAVGTTTFNDEYWVNLREYLQNNDPSKLGYVDRRGEDIDVVLCNDSVYQLPSETFFELMNFAKKDLDRARISYIFEKSVRESGTGYLTVLEKYRLQEKQGVIRYKSKHYSDSLRISFPDSRDIHLSFDSMIGEIKLKCERIDDNPFSLLFRHNRYDLVRLIREIDMKN